ncbi:MAG TPA: Lrp/AsnC ligand binding domain-containing protein [Pilimelia sp.]|nr:Lrp/AsnC ligand binding domain-containing protein [Pilimelia sp.]
MVHAYILVSTDIGTTRTVAAAIAAIAGVAQVDIVTGPYDIVVRAEADDLDRLAHLVVSQVQAVPGIARTTTCPVVRL